MSPFEPETRDRICRTVCASFGFGRWMIEFRETDHIQRVVIPGRRVSAGPRIHNHSLAYRFRIRLELLETMDECSHVDKVPDI